MKCLIKNCINTDEQGLVVYLNVFEQGNLTMQCICAPCWLSLHNEPGSQWSQIYRNMVELNKSIWDK